MLLNLYSSLIRGIRVLLVVSFISLILSACSLSDQLPRGVLIQALKTQILLTQVSIAESLDLQPIKLDPDVSRIRVDHQETLQVEGEQLIYLQGNFDWQLPQDSVRVDSGFEIYLQRGSYGQSWSLARPVSGLAGSDQRWLLYPLGLPTS